MPSDRFALYFSIASGVMVAAALIVPAFYRGSQRNSQPPLTIEQNVNEFFEKYDRNKDGVVDKWEYEMESHYHTR